MKLRAALTIVLIGIGASTAGAQDQTPPATPPGPTPPPVLENTGKPILLPFQCTQEDLHWAGLSCGDDEPCPLFLELTSAESAGDRVVAAGNVHTSSTTLASVLLASEDAGHSWREASEHIRGAGLDRIQFLDAQTGWVSGQILFPLEQDPFLLLTTDGGKTWRRRPVFSEARESRYGSIQQFSFADKDSGSLIIDRGQGSDGDRYELYESSDGGESWNIKETSTKPMVLKRPPPSATDWRVRADGPSGAFHIEHRQGQRWTGIAGFSVKIGACKPPA